MVTGVGRVKGVGEGLSARLVERARLLGGGAGVRGRRTHLRIRAITPSVLKTRHE